MEEKLLDILEDICDDDIFRDDFNLDLFEEGLMDSLAIAELIVAIEETFSITLPPDRNTEKRNLRQLPGF